MPQRETLCRIIPACIPGVGQGDTLSLQGEQSQEAVCMALLCQWGKVVPCKDGTLTERDGERLRSVRDVQECMRSSAV